MTAQKTPKRIFPRKGKSTTVDVIKFPLNKFSVYEITELELTTLENSSVWKSTYSILAGASWTAFASFYSITVTASISDENLRVAYTALTCIALVLSLVFSGFSLFSYRMFKSNINKLRKGR